MAPRFPLFRPSFARFERAELDQSIPGRFERQVDAGPDRLAVKCGPDAMTYGALDRAANRVALALQSLSGNQCPGVVLLIEQGAPLVAAILGVLKAGGAYIPLETSHPPDYVAGVFEESGAVAILADAAGARLATAAAPAAAVLRIDRTLEANGPANRPGIPVGPDAPAYVYYTSGSTGRPKGVVDTHRNVLHNVMRYTNSLGIDRDDRLTLLQSPSFSGAVSSLFGALLNGAAVFPYDIRRLGATGLGPWVVRERISIYHSVPVLFRLAAAGAEAFPDLRIIRLEGDQMSRRDWDVFRGRFSAGCVLVNGLGATECGLVRQFFIDPAMPPVEGVVPIGYPVEDMDVQVVDGEGRPVAVGDVGTIAVRSRYLAAGYRGRPDLTERAFVEDPAVPGMRTYRTGDLGRLHPDGCLEHLGRNDARRRLRGEWVDLAEVEAALLGAPGVREAAVRVLPGPSEDPRLVAYLVPREGQAPRIAALRAYLSARLLPAAVPSAFVMLARLPLTNNGKLDRDALTAAAVRPYLDRQPQPAGDGVSRSIVYLRQSAAEVLGLPASVIRNEDVLLDLGLDSLGALLLAHRIRTDLGIGLSMSTIIDSPSLFALAASIEAASEHQTPRPIPATGDR